MVRKKLGRGRKNRCRFCTKEGCPRPAFVDYKDVPTLKKLCTSQGKLFSRKRSGNCAAFQRAVKDAVTRAAKAAVNPARFMARLPYVGEYPTDQPRAPARGLFTLAGARGCFASAPSPPTAGNPGPPAG